MRAHLVLGVACLASPVLLTMTPAEAAPTCDGRPATIVAAPGQLVVNGTSGSDVIAAGAGDQTIYGQGGNDRVCGGIGADRLYGGPGHDRLFGGLDKLFTNQEGSLEKVGDQIRGGTGRDWLGPGRDTRAADEVTPDTISWDTSPRGVRIDLAQGTAVGTGPDSFDSTGAAVVGSAYADVITGTSGRDLVHGDLGSDEIRTHGGPDKVVADRGASATEQGADLVDGGAGDDELSALGGEDRLFGGPGNDTLDDMGRSADRLYGQSGDDLLIGELSFDAPPQAYYAGEGDDQLEMYGNFIAPGASGSSLWDMRTGALGLRTGDELVEVEVGGYEEVGLTTYETPWVIDGTTGNDVLDASTTGTEFDGHGGNDTFTGWTFDDVFRGGPGTDRAIAMNDGEDTCVSVEVLDQPDCENVSP